jgi:excisionase family DNA binding protein
MFNKRKERDEAILNHLKILIRMLEQKTIYQPVQNKVKIETRTISEPKAKLYRSREVAEQLGLSIHRFDHLKDKANQKPVQGGIGTGHPAMWSQNQVLWFKTYLNTGAHKTRKRRASKLLTPQQAAQFLGIGTKSFMRLIEDNEIPFKVLNSKSKFIHRRFKKSDLENWLSRNEWRVQV